MSVEPGLREETARLIWSCFWSLDAFLLFWWWSLLVGFHAFAVASVERMTCHVSLTMILRNKRFITCLISVNFYHHIADLVFFHLCHSLSLSSLWYHNVTSASKYQKSWINDGSPRRRTQGIVDNVMRSWDLVRRYIMISHEQQTYCVVYCVGEKCSLLYGTLRILCISFFI